MIRHTIPLTHGKKCYYCFSTLSVNAVTIHVGLIVKNVVQCSINTIGALDPSVTENNVFHVIAMVMRSVAIMMLKLIMLDLA